MAKGGKTKVNISSSKEVLIANINLPASKSISNRALILNAVIQYKFGKSISLKNLSQADDTLILQKALKQASGTIHVDNAGTCLRFLCAYFAAIPGIDLVLTGSERLLKRPIQPLIKALQSMGAQISYVNADNSLPIRIKGTALKGGIVQVEGNESSQFISALMLISPLLAEPLTLQVSNKIVSKAYIKLSQTMLQEMGIPCFISNEYNLVRTELIKEDNIPETYTIEADWSSAAFFYEAAVLADKADLFFENLQLNSIQGDAILANWMENFGIKSIQKETGVAISKIKVPTPIINSLDFTNHPDLAPAIICASAGASIPFCAMGIDSLQFKESQRISAIAKGLSLLHYQVQTNENSLCHDGLAHAFYQNSCLETEDDHRITMAFAIMAIAQSNMVLTESHSVKKSFPNFWEEAAKIGIIIR